MIHVLIYNNIMSTLYYKESTHKQYYWKIVMYLSTSFNQKI